MIIRTGDEAREMLSEARRMEYRYNDPLVYDYTIDNGVVLIRKRTKECIYIKQEYRMAIALQGSPEEFTDLKHNEKWFDRYFEMDIVDWSEIKEMVAWAPNVPK